MGAFSPYDNASLTFKVYSKYAVDPNTGNRVAVTQEEKYDANIQLQLSRQDQKPGIDENDINCTGRLLSPATFSSKVSVGSVAECTVNGLVGKLRITDLGSNTLTYARSILFQEFTGIFEQIGKGA